MTIRTHILALATAAMASLVLATPVEAQVDQVSGCINKKLGVITKAALGTEPLRPCRSFEESFTVGGTIPFYIELSHGDMVEFLSIGDISVTASCGGPGDTTLADFRTTTATGKDFAVSDTSGNEFKNDNSLLIAATSPAVESLNPATITTVDGLVIVTSTIQLTVNFIGDGICTFSGILAVSSGAVP